MARKLNEKGHRSWVVGGAVRDALQSALSAQPMRAGADFDLATDARPEEVGACFRKVIPTGIAHGTVTVISGGMPFEITSLRGEGDYTDGRRPDEVFFTSDLTLDLSRRDFTVNAIAYDPLGQVLSDPFQGIEDLNRQSIRAVGDPLRRFSEDGLRVLRAIRFCATLGFQLESTTEAALVGGLPSLAKVSFERVRDEFWKALSSPRPEVFAGLVERHEILLQKLPEWSSDAGRQGRTTDFSSLTRCRPSPELRFALLLGLGLADDTLNSEKVIASITSRFRLSREQAGLISICLHHRELPSLDGRTLRRALAQVGRESGAAWIEFLAARHGTSGEEAVTLLQQELQSSHPLRVSELAITGGDLIQAGLLPKGPSVGACLAHLLELSLDDPGKNQREILLHRAKIWAAARPSQT